MASELSASGASFNILSGSHDFLNQIIDNISSCVLLLNNKMELQAYNDALKTIFSNKKDEDLLYQRCGEAIGCAYSVDEMKRCGETSQCRYCTLREKAMFSYLEKKPVYKEKIERDFFNIKGKKVLKHLQFSTKYFRYKDEPYIIMILDDITTLETQNNLIQFQEEKIKELIHKN